MTAKQGFVSLCLESGPEQGAEFQGKSEHRFMASLSTKSSTDPRDLGAS